MNEIRPPAISPVLHGKRPDAFDQLEAHATTMQRLASAAAKENAQLRHDVKKLSDQLLDAFDEINALRSELAVLRGGK